MPSVAITFSQADIRALRASHLKPAITRAMRKASSTSARDMRSEASKRVRARKRLKARDVKKALKVRRNTGRTLDDMQWGVDVRGTTTRLVDYPHRQIKRGVSVTVNRGKRTLLKGAFIATMPNPKPGRKGHTGIFLRRGRARNPIYEILGSRPVDALLHAGEAEGVAERGRSSFMRTAERLLKAELEKGVG